MIVDGFYFDQTSKRSPEQYNVYLLDENNKYVNRVAYVRFRSGLFTVTCPGFMKGIDMLVERHGDKFGNGASIPISKKREFLKRAVKHIKIYLNHYSDQYPLNKRDPLTKHKEK